MKTLYDSLTESFEILLDANCFKKPDGIATGFKNLDNMLRGMNKGCLTVLGSKPSLGAKSSDTPASQCKPSRNIY